MAPSKKGQAEDAKNGKNDKGTGKGKNKKNEKKEPEPVVEELPPEPVIYLPNMNVPPAYGDLGKSARDLFNKGYNYGFHKVEVKTKTNSGVEFSTTGSSNHDTGKFIGSLETKYKCYDYGLTMLEKWNTDNTLGTEVTLEDQILKGLKVSFDTTFSPQTGKKSGKVKSSYSQDHVNMSCDVEFDFAGPTVHGAAVTGLNGWLAGYQMAFDTAKNKLVRNNFAIGYQQEDFTLHTAVNDGTEFVGSVFQKVKNDLDVGVNLQWTAGSNATKFGLAAKYACDKDTTYRAKVNNTSQVGLSVQHKLRQGIMFTASSLIDCKNFNTGGHKIGFGLEFDM